MPSPESASQPMPQSLQDQVKSQPAIFIVIVLYRMAALDSPTYRTLQAALATHSGLQTELLLYDNTPSEPPPSNLPANVHYLATPVNTGLATAYNLAVQMAAQRGFVWLLTLDQDTELPADFFLKLVPLASQYQVDSSLAAIVPHITAGARTVSPHWFLRHTFPRWFPADYSGIPDHAVYAFNSGSLLRVQSIQQVGGYNPLFWLDNSDISLYRQFERHHLRVFVAGFIHIQHDFSMTNTASKMSLTRYRNALEAGSAFCDLELGVLAGIEHTCILLRRYLKQLLKRDSLALRAATLHTIRGRLFTSRRYRLAAWTQAQHNRIAGYSLNNHPACQIGGTSTIVEQPITKSHLPGIFVVIVLYRTTIAAASSVATLRAALALHPDPARFRVLLYDNSPEPQDFASLPPDVLYHSDPSNAGLSAAYNHAAHIAASQGFSWLLTLDQDSALPLSFLTRLSSIVDQVDPTPRVAAILPCIVEGPRLLSPHWFLWDLLARPFPPGFSGVAPHSGYGFNSAATIRLSALQAIGGYSPLFPLDYSDAYLFRMLHLSRFQAYIAGDLAVEHHLSILDTGQMSDDRFRNILHTGSAFCDLMRGPLVGAQFTATTFKSWLASLLRRRSPQKTAILAKLLRDRLFTSKSRRIAQWKASHSRADVRHEPDRV